MSGIISLYRQWSEAVRRAAGAGTDDQAEPHMADYRKAQADIARSAPTTVRELAIILFVDTDRWCSHPSQGVRDLIAALASQESDDE